MTSGLILTDVGAAEIESAYQAGQVVRITRVAFGDGGGAPVTPDPAAVALAGEFGREPFSQGESEDGMISGKTVIPARQYSGKTLREVGLISDADTLIAYGAYPETWLPEQSDTIIKEIELIFVMPLVHAGCVELVVDPNIGIVTIEEGDKRYYRQSLRLKEVADAGPDAQTEARTHLEVYSKAESDERFLNESENLADVPDKAVARTNLDIYSKEEGDERYQSKGNYTPAGEAYTKTESDERFLNESENLADVPDKAVARANLDIYSKEEGDERYQPKGNYTPAGEAYTKTESDARYITMIRQATQGSFTVTHDADMFAPDGSYLNGYHFEGDNPGGDTMFYRAMQVEINNTWVNVGYNTARSEARKEAKPLPASGLAQLIRLKHYLPEGWPSHLMNYIDESGYIWDEVMSSLVGKVFIACDSDGVIRQIDGDATMLNPDGLSVYGCETLPEDCSIDGSWIYDGETFTRHMSALAGRRESLKQQRIRQAIQLMPPLNAAVQLNDISEGETQRLKDLLTYVRELQALDVSASPDTPIPDLPQ